MTSYPAITIWQPWASLIAHGAKQFEFRPWPAPPHLRGERIAIHAGRRKVDHHEVQALLLRLRARDSTQLGLIPALATPLLEMALSRPAAIPLGAVLCLATLGEPIRDAELAAALGSPWPVDGNVSRPSNWGWPLSAIEPLDPPVPAHGAQGFWTWTSDADGR